MVYLLLAIGCSALTMIMLKLSATGDDGNRHAVTFINQTTAFIVSLFFLGGTFFSTKWIPALIDEAPGVFSNGLKFSEAGSCGYAILVAVLGGLISYLAYFMLTLSTEKNGSAMTVTFNKVGVLIPAVLSVIFFHEVPTVFQVVGVALAIIAIILVYFKKEEMGIVTLRAALLGTMFFGGFCDFVSKIYEYYGQENGQSVFLTYMFFFALIISGIAMLMNNRNISKNDIKYGVITGVTTQFISKFLLKSLSTLEAFIVFPMFSVGVIIVITFVNLLFFKEKLSKRQYIATAIMIASCILMNI